MAAHLNSGLRQYFQTIAELNRDRNLRIRSQLVELVDLLNRAGIRPIFLKGTAHLLLGLYREVADRVIGDIDLLIAKEDFDEAIRVLTKAGYRSLAGHSDHAHHHHYPALGRDGRDVSVEVHKDATKRIYGRALPTSPLIQAARTIHIDDKQAAIPCPEDLLVHNIVHSQMVDRGFWSAEFSLREAYDLVLLAHRFREDLDWTRLAARLTTDIGSNRAGFYVRRAHLLFGQRPPPIGWPLGARLADRRWIMHANGRMARLRPATRLLAYGAQGLQQFMESSAERRWSLRRLAAAEWYVERWRAFADRGWREAGRSD